MQANPLYNAGLYMYIVVDNFNVKTNLLCNVSLFQQTNMVKTQMHFLYVSTSEFSTLGTFSTSSKSDIKPIDYVRNFVLDENFVV